MKRLRDVVDHERGLLCVGRETELAALDAWLRAAASSSTCVFSVTGMGGIGKSTLLLQMLQRARQHHVTGVWIDGRACGRSPAGFLHYLSTMPEIHQLTDNSPVGADTARDDEGLFAPGQRVIWCIDHYEELEFIDGWLRERFFSQLPAIGHLIVIASRHECEGWRSDPGWRSRVRWFPLSPLTRRASRLYLRRMGVDDDWVEEIARMAGGLPLALALAADAFTRQTFTGRRDGRAERAWTPTHKVTARLLSEAAGEDLEPLLDLLAIVPEVDGALFADVFGGPLSRAQLASLTNLSFVQSTKAGLRLHDVARVHLWAELRERDPERFRHMRRLAVASLRRRLETATPGQRTTIAASLLTVCADALPSVESYARLMNSPAITVRLARADDGPALHALADAWRDQPALFRDPTSYGVMLDKVLTEFPEGCRVIHEPNGSPLAFVCVLLLFGETVRLIDSVEPGVLRRWVPHEYSRLADLRPEQADTYVCAMVGVNHRHEEYSLAELVGMIVREGLAHLGESTRALVGGSAPAFEQLLKQLGFKRYNEQSDADQFMYVLDLRNGRFGPWVTSFLDVADAEGIPTRPPSRTPTPLVPSPTRRSTRPPTVPPLAVVPVDRLRELLVNFHNTSLWAHSPVPPQLGWTAAHLHARLRAALNGDEPLPEPFTDYDRELLLRTYIREQSAQAAAERLHISRATYYRHLGRALERLQKALAQEVP